MRITDRKLSDRKLVVRILSLISTPLFPPPPPPPPPTHSSPSPPPFFFFVCVCVCCFVFCFVGKRTFLHLVCLKSLNGLHFWKQILLSFFFFFVYVFFFFLFSSFSLFFFSFCLSIRVSVGRGGGVQGRSYSIVGFFAFAWTYLFLHVFLCWLLIWILWCYNASWFRKTPSLTVHLSQLCFVLISYDAASVARQSRQGINDRRKQITLLNLRPGIGYVLLRVMSTYELWLREPKWGSNCGMHISKQERASHVWRIHKKNREASG